MVTVHFQLAENAELLAELHEQLPPQNDPAGALGAPGACADVVAQHGCSGGTLPAAVREKIRGSTLAELRCYLATEDGDPVELLGDRWEAVVVLEY